MSDAPFDFDANPDFVAQYDRGPPLFNPGYAASHVMAAAVLADRIGPTGELLVIGAGGGVEIAAFHRLSAGWSYVGVDPSQAMLDLAAARMQHEAPEASVNFVHGIATDAPKGPFDGATAFHCLVFAPDDGTRLAQLKSIHARLKPGAPFLISHAATDAAQRATDLSRYAHHARLLGAEDELIERASEMVQRQVHILSGTREEELLREAGFTFERIFFHGLWIYGWEATA